MGELIARSVTLGYGDRVVARDLDVEVPAGRITSIVGPNGCGKSTLLRGFSRLLAPSSGEILLDGDDVATLPARELARRLGLLPQSPITPEAMTVAELVGLGRHPHRGMLGGWSRADQDAVDEALEMTRTAELAGRRVDQLSGGQRQRVWIATVLAQRTATLLLDEPISFLDIARAVEVLDLVVDLNRQRGALTVSLIRVPRVAILAAKKVVDNEGDPNLVGFLNAVFHEDASGTGALYWGDLGVAIAYVENMRYAALGVTP